MASENRNAFDSVSKNIGDSIYIALRKNIANLNLTPGEPLNIKDISQKLNVSRTPVREALIKLGKEGLVDVIPQKGTSVSRIDVKRVDEEKFIRQSLEEKVMELFINERRPAEIAELRRYIALQKETLSSADYLLFLEHDDDFHRVFFESTGKHMSWEIIQNMSGHYRRVRLMSLWDESIVRNVIDQHEAILAAIEAADVEAAVRHVREHSSGIAKVELTLLKKFPSYFRESEGDNFLVKDFMSLT